MLTVQLRHGVQDVLRSHRQPVLGLALLGQVRQLCPSDGPRRQQHHAGVRAADAPHSHPHRCVKYRGSGRGVGYPVRLCSALSLPRHTLLPMRSLVACLLPSTRALVAPTPHHSRTCCRRGGRGAPPEPRQHRGGDHSRDCGPRRRREAPRGHSGARRWETARLCSQPSQL